MRGQHYILTEERQVIEVDLMTWAKWFETADRHVADTYTETTRVSTVFLGLDHNFTGKGPPLLYETIVFEREGHENPCLPGMLVHEALEMYRYSTWDEAEAGHKAIVKRILKAEQEAMI